MNKSYLAAVTLISLLVLTPLASSKSIAQPKNDFWHESDYYAVQFDGEGDAFVVYKTNIQTFNASINKLTIESPYRNIKVYRAAIKNQDNDYPYGDTETNPVNYDISRRSDSAQITIDTTIPRSSQKEIIIAYQIPELAENNIRGYRFDFETFTDNDALMREVGVDIQPPQDMKLKGKGKSNVDFSPTTFATSQSLSSANLRRLERESVNAEHTARNLDPGETMHVKGLYGKSSLLMNIYTYTAFLGILIAVLGVSLKTKWYKNVSEMFELPETTEALEEFNPSRGLVAGLVSGISFLIVAWTSITAAKMMENMFEGSELGVFIFLALAILDLLFIILTLLGPTTYLFQKTNWKEALISLVVTLLTVVTMGIALGAISDQPHMIATTGTMLILLKWERKIF